MRSWDIKGEDPWKKKWESTTLFLPINPMERRKKRTKN